MGDEREIRFRGIPRGPWTIDRLYRAVMNGQFDHTAEYLSETKNQWLPLAGILEDLDTTVTTEERLKQMKEAGIEKVEFLPGDKKTDCPSCRAIARKIYPIDNVPKVPPSDCSCVPWCRLCVIARK